MKLLIVDDMRSPHVVVENLVREADPVEYPFEEILHAYNGQECIQCIRDQQPDVLIMDMEMPIMNGMDVFQSVPPEDMPIVIVLSAYDNFGYIQQAMHSNAFDYLLKPISPDALLNTLKRAVEKHRSDVIVDICRYLAASDGPITYRLGCIHRDMLYISHWVARHGDCAAPQLPPEIDAVTLTVGREEYIMLHQSQHVSPVALAEHIARNPQAYVDYRVQISDRILRQPSDLPDCIARFRSDTGESAFYARRATDEDSSRPLLARSPQGARYLLEDIEPETLNGFVDDLFNDIAKTYPNEKDYNQILCDTLLRLLKYAFDEYPLDLSALASTGTNTVQDVKKSFTRILQTLITQSASDSIDKRNNFCDVDAAKAYIDAHFMENFTLEELAASVYMSKFNLCRKFKQRYQIGIWNYVKQARLNRACVLLRSTDMKILKIAYDIGFSDASYFSNVFHSVYGMSPQAYRRQHRDVKP